MFHHFLDDAAIFPPGNMAMDEAVNAHLARRGTPDGEYVGPFICSAARLGELREALGHGHLELSLVATVDELAVVGEELRTQQNLTLVAVELKGDGRPAAADTQRRASVRRAHLARVVRGARRRNAQAALRRS